MASLEDHLYVGVQHRENSPGFSFRQYLAGFGITNELHFQAHCNHVQVLEEKTGLKLKLNLYDPTKLQDRLERLLN